ncbi:DUF420 domain-containing protein [Haloferacaceae archaeon DSL9]
MEFQARNHVPALAAILSAIALSLVFGAVLGRIPRETIPRSETLVAVIPHINALVSSLAIVTIVAGWRTIRRGDVEGHRRLMLGSFALFAAFLVLYLYRVALEGPAAFPGPESVYRIVYLPTLAIHIFLAIVCVPLLFYVLLLAVTRPVADIYETRHRAIGRIAAVLWLISFALGIVVYLLLYAIY